MLKQAVFIGLLSLILGSSSQALAHTPLCSCYKNGDGTVTCEGGFSDGSSAAGVEMRVEDVKGKLLLKGKMDELSEFTFDEPSGAYNVILDAGPGHKVKIDGREIAD